MKTMEEGPITHPGVPEEQYHTLGSKTFWLFLLQRMPAPATLFLLSILLVALSGQNFWAKPELAAYAPYVGLVTLIILILFAVTFIAALVISWLIYATYKFYLGEDSLRIKRGILNKEEVAIPYRQIQDVNIRRDIGFRVMGLSRIVILTAGEDPQKDDESEGIFPALDKDLGEWLQAELLKRANVQKVVQVTPAQ